MASRRLHTTREAEVYKMLVSLSLHTMNISSLIGRLAASTAFASNGSPLATWGLHRGLDMRLVHGASSESPAPVVACVACNANPR